jgi:AcrR family transcriptional regulator
MVKPQDAEWMAKKTVQTGNPDGRRRRTEQSREQIVAAMLEIVREGTISPAAEEVAERAGVGLRTVFRLFDNMESLYRQIAERMTAEIRPLWERPLASSEWPGVLNEMIDRRCRLYDRIMPFKIAAEAHRHLSPFLAGHIAGLNRELRDAIIRAVPREMHDDTQLIESLDLVLSFETWRRLRKDQKLSPNRARQTVERLTVALLRPAGTK